MSFFGMGKSVKEKMEEVHDKAIRAEFKDWYYNFYTNDKRTDSVDGSNTSFKSNRKKYDNEELDSSNDAAILAASMAFAEEENQRMIQEAAQESINFTEESMAESTSWLNEDMQTMDDNMNQNNNMF